MAVDASGAAATYVSGLPLGAGLGGSIDRPISLPAVSLEAGIYTLVVAVALLLRLWRIDDLPLSPQESRTALASLEIARGGRLPSDAGALLGFGNALVFMLVGATDAIARVLPALIGGLAPLTLAWARPLLGRRQAALAAVLLAISPLMLDRARIVGSAAIAMTISLALVFACFEYARARQPSRLYWTAVLLALALTAGSSAFSALIALALFGIVLLLRRGRVGQVPSDLDAAVGAIAPANGRVDAVDGCGTPRHAGPARQHVVRAAAIFGATLAIVATGGLTTLIGVQDGLFAPLGAWLGAAPTGRLDPIWVMPLSAFAYEPFALVVGLVGAVLARRSRRPIDQFMVWWLALAAVVALVSADRGPSLLLAAVVPATILAAHAIDRLLLAARPAGPIPYLVALGTLGWGAALVVIGFGQVSLTDPVGIGYIARALERVVGPESSGSTARYLVAFLPVALLLGGAVYVLRRFGAAGRPAVGLAAATLLLAASVHVGWNLTYQVVGNVAELPRASQTSVDVRTLRDDVDTVWQVLTINRQTANPRLERSLAIDESLRDPLAWYLQDKSPRIGIRPGTAPGILVVPVEVKPPQRRYAGQQYQMALAERPVFTNLAKFWRWLIYREPPTPIETVDVMLYVRAQ